MGVPRIDRTESVQIKVNLERKNMKQIIIFLLVLSVWAGLPKNIFADSWPKVNKAKKRDQCKQALMIAKAMFQSDANVLYAPPVIPTKSTAALVLGPSALDISGGDALKADKAAFTKLPIPGPGAPRSIYWQRAAKYGYRLVVWETLRGWRGDTYSLYAVGEKYKPEEFLAATSENQSSSKFTPILSDVWRPPLIFRKKESGDFWFIDVGETYQFLADWQVYECGPAGAKPVCSIQFRPAANNATDLLPPPVRKLEVLLDKTMGEGKNEGTLQQTAHLRIDVETTWANIMLRPWALNEPYNTRKEVDDGLKDWSHNGPSEQKLYRRIQQQYPKAARSLAEYYQKNFGLSPRKAKIQSSYALDIALRSHYAFHSDDPNKDSRFDGVKRNPWQKNQNKNPSFTYSSSPR